MYITAVNQTRPNSAFTHILFSAAVFGCILPICGPCSAQQQAVGSRYMVTSGHQLATLAGLEILKEGGNVMDAAVTTSLCLGVVEPYGSGLGGKLVMLYRDAESGDVDCIESLCPSPRHLDPEHFTNLEPSQRKHGYRAVCVPGLPAGLYRAHQRWGSLDWSRLVQPAIQLAESGFEVDEKLKSFFDPKVEKLRDDPEAARLYLVDGESPPAGTVLRNPDLAESLRRLAEHGARGFYEGPTAEKITIVAQQNGSPLCLEDFADYQPRETKPIAVPYRGHCIHAAPPPLTGGITVLMALEMLESKGSSNSNEGSDSDLTGADWIDAIGRNLQCIYPRVRDGIADVASARNTACELLQPDRIAQLSEMASGLDPAHPNVDPLFESELATADDLDDASTTHLCVMDQSGNMVSITQSLSYHFGASVVAPGTGILLNNSMSNFATKRSTSVNFAAGGKRPRSTVTPIVIEKASQPVACLGIPGGQRIPTTTLQLISHVIDFDRTFQQAFDQPRFHLRRPLTRESMPNAMDVESGTDELVMERLRAGGWRVEQKDRDGRYFGGGSAITRTNDGTLIGVADTRRTNFAAGE